MSNFPIVDARDPVFEAVEAQAALVTRAENAGLKEAEVDIIYSRLSSRQMSAKRADEILTLAEQGEDIGHLLKNTSSL